jgi:DNA polymerase III delta' subunit
VSVWQGLQGQERAVAQLRRSIERGRVPHAYLFSGPPGAPLGDAAIALAMALSCQRAPGDGSDADPDGMCSACAKIASGIHPDVVTLVREGAAQIVPIESVRNQVIARVGYPPHEGELRVFIVEEATALAPPAANALLKTLEEPPSRTLFMLCTTAPDQLLPTIRSRCQRVRFAAAVRRFARGEDGVAAVEFALVGPLIDHDMILSRLVAWILERERRSIRGGQGLERLERARADVRGSDILQRGIEGSLVRLHDCLSVLFGGRGLVHLVLFAEAVPEPEAEETRDDGCGRDLNPAASHDRFLGNDNDRLGGGRTFRTGLLTLFLAFDCHGRNYLFSSLMTRIATQ